jgi:carboxyl-terminal processing protease
MNRKSLFFLLPVFGILFFLFGFQVARWQILTVSKNISVEKQIDALANKGTSLDPSAIDLSTFWEVWKRVHTEYLRAENADTTKLVYGATKGMVAALGDPYTVYMTPTESEDFRDDLDGTLRGGIGAELTVKDKNLVVASVLKKSPAEKAGILPRDIILEINGKDASEMSIYDAVGMIRGKPNTQVKLLLFRETTLAATGVMKSGTTKKSGTPFEVIVTRQKINLESVTVEKKTGDFYHVTLHQFTDRTPEEFSAIAQEILEKNGKGIILDLRNNGGGYLDVAVDILSEFLDGKRAAVQIRRNSDASDTIAVGNHAPLKNMPLVLLVNDGSASASEIVAGALQDHKRAILIGEKTFGKGSVQEVQKLSDGSTLRMTIAEWFTPKGRGIDHVGIPADIEVKFTEEDARKNRDPQLERAMEYLKTLRN